MLRDMSGLKMMGLTEVIGEIVQDERARETKQMEAAGWINVWQNVVCKLWNLDREIWVSANSHKQISHLSWPQRRPSEYTQSKQ